MHQRAALQCIEPGMRRLDSLRIEAMQRKRPERARRMVFYHRGTGTHRDGRIECRRLVIFYLLKPARRMNCVAENRVGGQRERLLGNIDDERAGLELAFIVALRIIRMPMMISSSMIPNST